MKLQFAAAVLCIGTPCWAQSPAAEVPQRGGEAAVVRTVSEDDSVRVEELRVRGQTRRIVVRSKLPGAPAYDIGTGTDGRDVTQDRRAEGRSLWQLFSF